MMIKEMKFNVGDKVKILDGSHIENYKPGWSSEMNRFIGKIGTILDYELGEYILSEPEFEFYAFDENGLELVESADSVRLRHLETVFGRDNVAAFCLMNAYNSLLKYKTTKDRVWIFEAKSWMDTYQDVDGEESYENEIEWAERIESVIDRYIKQDCK